MVICEALQISPEELLIGREYGEEQTGYQSMGYVELEQKIQDTCRQLSDEQKKRVLAFMSMLQNMKE